MTAFRTGLHAAARTAARLGPEPLMAAATWGVGAATLFLVWRWSGPTYAPFSILLWIAAEAGAVCALLGCAAALLVPRHARPGLWPVRLWVIGFPMMVLTGALLASACTNTVHRMAGDYRGDLDDFKGGCLVSGPYSSRAAAEVHVDLATVEVVPVTGDSLLFVRGGNGWLPISRAELGGEAVFPANSRTVGLLARQGCL
ncbi:hypothetical protein [Amycolatopsis sp. WGS_07]|uniref:hypothetical protein n=1 Tax=Amycolatopsis sp. WGS_07 TaxID=3076764 RepID=UPI003873409E